MKTLGAVESFTGGLFAAKVTSYSGVSRFFKGALVTYTNEIKTKFGIDISGGVINKQCALAMAKRGKEILNVDYCVAFTGNAGPTTMENKKQGLVFIAINQEVYELELFGNRREVQEQAINFAWQKIQKLIGKEIINDWK